MSGRPPVTAVFFDVGETLIDESTEYHAWADWLGVPRHTFSAVFGQTLARGQGYRQVFHRFRPGFDLAEERRRRAEAGLAEHVDGRDLYPDVRDCLTRLRAAGYVVGVAGNQTARAGRLLGELNLPTDLVATSADWGWKARSGLLRHAGRRRRPAPSRDPLRRRPAGQRHPPGRPGGAAHRVRLPRTLGLPLRRRRRAGHRRPAPDRARRAARPPTHAHHRPAGAPGPPATKGGR